MVCVNLIVRDKIKIISQDLLFLMHFFAEGSAFTP